MCMRKSIDLSTNLKCLANLLQVVIAMQTSAVVSTKPDHSDDMSSAAHRSNCRVLCSIWIGSEENVVMILSMFSSFTAMKVNAFFSGVVTVQLCVN